MAVVITKGWVEKWSNEYDHRFLSGDTTKWDMEQELRSWLASLPGKRYLDREHFLLLGEWKSARQRQNYRRNSEEEIISATREAFVEADLEKKLDRLTKLHGVGLAVGATILHFLHPDEIAIFDYHARNVLLLAGEWNRETDGNTTKAWLEYNSVIVRLTSQLNVSIRTLDKALWGYDKWAI